jgi:undecaprenyl-diphosphatase
VQVRETIPTLNVVTHLLAVDEGLRAWVVAHRVHLLDGVMWTLSAVGRGGIVWFVIGAVAAWRRRRWSDFVTLSLAVLLAWLLADVVLKPAIGRERPFVRAPGAHVIGGKPHDASFPSGHAANAFAAARVLSVTVPGAWVVWWSLAIATGYSRVYLGVHYPLDVVAGAGIGFASAALVLAGRRSMPHWLSARSA